MSAPPPPIPPPPPRIILSAPSTTTTNRPIVGIPQPPASSVDGLNPPVGLRSAAAPAVPTSPLTVTAMSRPNPPPPPPRGLSSPRITSDVSTIPSNIAPSSTLPPPPPPSLLVSPPPRHTLPGQLLRPPPPPAIVPSPASRTKTKSVSPFIAPPPLPLPPSFTGATASPDSGNLSSNSFLTHAVQVARMPSLMSAPVSANINLDDLASKMSSASNELLQGAADFFQQAQSQTASFATTASASPRYVPSTDSPPPRSPSTRSQISEATAIHSPQSRQQRQQQQHYSPTFVAIPTQTSPSQTRTANVRSPTSPALKIESREVPSESSSIPPPFLPYTEFRPKPGSTSNSSINTVVIGSGGSELAPVTASQTSIPILIIATESASAIAHKNGLRLCDLFEGLVQKSWMNNTNASAAASGMTSIPNNIVPGGSTNNYYYLPQFRSATKTYSTLTWDDLAVITFIEPDKLSELQEITDEVAAQRLQDAVIVQPTDGNLQQELNVLEDQIDNLLYSAYDDDNVDDNYAYRVDEDNSSSDDLMSHYEKGQRRQEQACKDAYQLTSPTYIPWLWRYRLALDESTSSGSAKVQHDMYNCPVLILTVCTTSEELGTVETLSMLSNQSFYLPSTYYKNGLYDPNSVRQEVVVLHDICDGPKGWDESALKRTLQNKYGQCSAVLRVNSIPLSTAHQLAKEESSDLWGGNGQLGNCLSLSDRASIRKYFINLIQNGVLPALERRISDLNAIVNDRKKGVKNVLKSLWGGGRQPNAHNRSNSDDFESGIGGQSSSQHAGGISSTGAKAGTILYRYDSIESQTRLLGDSLFIMKDYETAMSMYRLIRDDYKQDRAWVHYGSIQEAIALCLFYMDPYRNSKEIFATIESALLSYNRAATEEMKSTVNSPVGERATQATLSTRLAARLCLILASAALRSSIVNGRYLEVADLLASASSGETSLGAAVLLEQSASHYYQCEMYRKYAFHMLMSGHMFRSAVNADHHAFRCFTSAVHIYSCTGAGKRAWDELQNHLRSALASLLFTMGRMSIALQLYAKLLGTSDGGRVSMKTQQKFISNLLEICTDHKKKALAGVDRMIAQSSSSAQREAMRKDHLDRIVQVIQYTKSASRILEIPNMDLPFIDDSTVAVVAEEQQHFHQRSKELRDNDTRNQQIGEAKEGSQQVWDDLMLWTIAELNAASESATLNNNTTDDFGKDTKNINKPYGGGQVDVLPSTILKALQRVDDADMRRVLTCMEKEKASRQVTERTKRRSKGPPRPPVRAQMEPIMVEFTMKNPLGLAIDLFDVQLVAKMTATTMSSDSAPSKLKDRVCTNEGAVYIKPLVTCNESEKWTFQDSSLPYEVADFCRISSAADTGKQSSSSDQKKVSWKAAGDIDPFFVVSKGTYTLEPESSLRISASICPLIQGNLEIVGVRCRLLDSVWVYHPFRLKGPLLHNTRTNRTNRIRAESVLLKAKVGRGMPCINVDLIQRHINQEVLSPKPASELELDNGVETSALPPKRILQGELGAWSLRVRNVGTAPAACITMKTNVPWITIEGSGTIDENVTISANKNVPDRCATSFCVGPSGTLMDLPIEDFGCLQVPGQIQPGEAVDIPVLVRTSGFDVGRQQFYMLFRYELPNENEGPDIGKFSIAGMEDSKRFRWFKKMFEVPILPSLSLSASIIPSFEQSSRNEHIVSVEFSNLRADLPTTTDILLQSMTLTSRHYRLESIPGQFSRPVVEDGMKMIKLGHQERVTVHYRLVPKNDKSQSLLSECNVADQNSTPNEGADKSILRSLRFLCLERAHSACTDAMTSYQMALCRATAQADDEGNYPRSIAEIRRANAPADSTQASTDGGKGLVVSHPTSIERLCPDNGLDNQIIHLICTWNNFNHQVQGEHHIRNMPIIRPYASGTKDGCPITITATHPDCITNNFRNGPAIVPIKIILRNRLSAGIDNNTVEIDFAINQPDNFVFVSYPQEGYRRQLKGGEEMILPLRALLPKAGIYDLQKLRLSTLVDTTTNTDMSRHGTLHEFPQKWMVTAKAV